MIHRHEEKPIEELSAANASFTVSKSATGTPVSMTFGFTANCDGKLTVLQITDGNCHCRQMLEVRSKDSS